MPDILLFFSLFLSDGSEASNSSSSASATANATDANKQQHDRSSCDDVVQLRQRPATQQQSTATTGGPAEVDEWTSRASHQHRRPPLLQRQASSLVETDGDVSQYFYSYHHNCMLTLLGMAKGRRSIRSSRESIGRQPRSRGRTRRCRRLLSIIDRFIIAFGRKIE